MFALCGASDWHRAPRVPESSAPAATWYAAYYSEVRTHLALAKCALVARSSAPESSSLGMGAVPL